jgi:Holliday junction resolvase RusA-like endonuclease
LTTSYRVHIPARPIAKGRGRVSKQTGAVYTPKQTVVAEAWVRLCCTEQVGTPRVPGPVGVRVVFVVPIPKSKPRQWREDAQAGRVMPTGRPDVDNLSKLACDALNGIAWADDAEVVEMDVVKVYGAEPCTAIEWRQLTPAGCQARSAEAQAIVGAAERARTALQAPTSPVPYLDLI